MLGSFFGQEAHATTPIYDPSYAVPAYNCSSGTGCCAAANVPNLVNEMITGTNLYASQPKALQTYYMDTLWPKIETALKKAADDMRNVVVYSTTAMGAMLDGQTFNQAMLALQKQSVDSMQTETVSDQICRFGTLSRSLAQSQDRARDVQLGLATEMAHRQMLRINMNAGNADGKKRLLGRTADKMGRFAQFQTKFCDPADANTGLANPVCKATSEIQANRDIDMTRSLGAPLTLDIDFTGNSAAAKPTADEENIFALSSNLYGNDLAVNLGKSDFELIKRGGSNEATAKLETLFNFRSAIAKRSVAQNSFAALAGMKAAGSTSSKTYMQAILKELGLTDTADLTAAIGDNPSYYAQMDMLTRKLYQTPGFYTNLMDSPTNVGRQQVAMEGIGLMQDRDTYESLRRSEMLMSSLLEIYVLREQNKFTDKGTKE